MDAGPSVGHKRTGAMSHDFYVYTGKNPSGHKRLVAVVYGGDARPPLAPAVGGDYSVHDGPLPAADGSFVTDSKRCRMGPRRPAPPPGKKFSVKGYYVYEKATVGPNGYGTDALVCVIGPFPFDGPDNCWYN